MCQNTTSHLQPFLVLKLFSLRRHLRLEWTHTGIILDLITYRLRLFLGTRIILKLLLHWVAHGRHSSRIFSISFQGILLEIQRTIYLSFIYWILHVCQLVLLCYHHLRVRVLVIILLFFCWIVFWYIHFLHVHNLWVLVLLSKLVPINLLLIIIVDLLLLFLLLFTNCSHWLIHTVKFPRVVWLNLPNVLKIILHVKGTTTTHFTSILISMFLLHLIPLIVYSCIHVLGLPAVIIVGLSNASIIRMEYLTASCSCHVDAIFIIIFLWVVTVEVHHCHTSSLLFSSGLFTVISSAILLVGPRVLLRIAIAINTLPLKHINWYLLILHHLIHKSLLLIIIIFQKNTYNTGAACEEATTNSQKWNQ